MNPTNAKEDFTVSYLTNLLGNAYKEGMTEDEIPLRSKQCTCLLALAKMPK